MKLFYTTILVVAAVRAGLGWHLGFLPFDDTYITFRYALNLAQGNGFVYNLNQFVLGTSTPLWTLLLALCCALKLPMAGSALALSLLADIATACLIGKTLLRLNFSFLTAGSAAVLFLCCFDCFSLARSGMETSLFALLILATLHETASQRYPSAGLFCGLACITRPEGSILGLVFLLSLWMHRKLVGRNSALLGLGLLILCVAGWSLFAAKTFGSVIPQSIVAKSFAVHTDPNLARLSWHHLGAFFLDGQAGDGIFLPTYLQGNFVWTLLSLVALLSLLNDCWRERSRQTFERALILLLFPVCYVGALAFCHAFTWFPWYYGPIYPFFALLTVLGASRLVGYFPLSARRTNVCFAATVTILLLGQLFAAILVKLPNNRSFWVKGYFQDTSAIPRSSQVTVAAFEIGAVGWKVWPANVLDVTGLVTPQSVGVSSDVLIKSARPDYIVLTTDNGVDFLAKVSAQPWFFQGYQQICAIRDPYGDREYRTYRLKPANLRRRR